MMKRNQKIHDIGESSSSGIKKSRSPIFMGVLVNQIGENSNTNLNYNQENKSNFMELVERKRRRRRISNNSDFDYNDEVVEMYLDSFPSGNRFCPSDEDLINDYLIKMINNQPLPLNKIKHLNIYDFNPQQLKEKYKSIGLKKWYFFTPREKKYANGSRPNRAAGNGYWRATGKDKPILHNNLVVGKKKTLVFFEGNPKFGTKTDWIMQEYRLEGESTKLDKKLDSVLCKIYENHTRKDESEEDEEDEQVFEDGDQTNLKEFQEEIIRIYHSCYYSDEIHKYFDTFPSGYKFHPTDKELILNYLMKKINNQPLPPTKIKDLNIYDYNPHQIAENYKPIDLKKWYFFTPRERKYTNGSRPNRAAGNGYWKASGKDKPILHNNLVVGKKKTLVFYEGKSKNGTKTDWIMQEYRLEGEPRRTEEKLDLVLCKIYEKEKGKGKDKSEKNEENKKTSLELEYNNNVGNEEINLMKNQLQNQYYQQDHQSQQPQVQYLYQDQVLIKDHQLQHQNQQHLSVMQTEWIMQEYGIEGESRRIDEKLDLVSCKIYEEEKGKDNEEDKKSNLDLEYNYNVENRANYEINGDLIIEEPSTTFVDNEEINMMIDQLQNHYYQQPEFKYICQLEEYQEPPNFFNINMDLIGEESSTRFGCFEENLIMDHHQQQQFQDQNHQQIEHQEDQRQHQIRDQNRDRDQPTFLGNKHNNTQFEGNCNNIDLQEASIVDFTPNVLQIEQSSEPNLLEDDIFDILSQIDF